MAIGIRQIVRRAGAIGEMIRGGVAPILPGGAGRIRPIAAGPVGATVEGAMAAGVIIPPPAPVAPVVPAVPVGVAVEIPEEYGGIIPLGRHAAMQTRMSAALATAGNKYAISTDFNNAANPFGKCADGAWMAGALGMLIVDTGSGASALGNFGYAWFEGLGGAAGQMELPLGGVVHCRVGTATRGFLRYIQPILVRLGIIPPSQPQVFASVRGGAVATGAAYYGVLSILYAPQGYDVLPPQFGQGALAAYAEAVGHGAASQMRFSGPLTLNTATAVNTDKDNNTTPISLPQGHTRIVGILAALIPTAPSVTAAEQVAEAAILTVEASGVYGPLELLLPGTINHRPAGSQVSDEEAEVCWAFYPLDVPVGAVPVIRATMAGQAVGTSETYAVVAFILTAP